MRVTVKDDAPAPSTRQEGGRSRRGRRGGRGRGRRNGAESSDRRDGDGRSEEDPPRRSDEDPPRRSERSATRSKPDYTAVSVATPVPDAPDDVPTKPADDAEDETDYAGHTLRDLLTLLGLTETEISARDPETPGDGVGLISQVLDIFGENEDASDELRLLIGRRGETLQSLQYLLNVIVSSRYDSDRIFSVDIDGYRRRREQSLVEMAQRVAGDVRASGDVITLEPMSPAERRIIHITLKDEDGVQTQSVGQGSDRQVEVLPD